MKRSGGLQQRKGSAFIYETEKKAFWKAEVIKKIQRTRTSVQRESLMVRCWMLAAYHAASQRLTLARIFMCEYILMKSVSLNFPSHLCVGKLLELCVSLKLPLPTSSTLQPVTEMIHKSICSTKAAR